MSYDVVIGKNWVNHTYNGCEACKVIIGITPKDFDGLQASVVKLYALYVYNELKRNHKKYECYMPNNGWGTIKTWINFMHKIVQYCEEEPDEIVSVN